MGESFGKDASILHPKGRMCILGVAPVSGGPKKQKGYLPMRLGLTELLLLLIIALLASFLSPFLGDAVIAEMTCVGSLLIIALALNMLGVTKIKVMNLVPACVLPIFLFLFL